jgi:hypothetical protein
MVNQGAIIPSIPQVSPEVGSFLSFLTQRPEGLKISVRDPCVDDWWGHTGAIATELMLYFAPSLASDFVNAIKPIFAAL